MTPTLALVNAALEEVAVGDVHLLVPPLYNSVYADFFIQPIKDNPYRYLEKLMKELWLYLSKHSIKEDTILFSPAPLAVWGSHVYVLPYMDKYGLDDNPSTDLDLLILDEAKNYLEPLRSALEYYYNPTSFRGTEDQIGIANETPFDVLISEHRFSSYTDKEREAWEFFRNMLLQPILYVGDLSRFQRALSVLLSKRGDVFEEEAMREAAKLLLLKDMVKMRLYTRRDAREGITPYTWGEKRKHPALSSTSFEDALAKLFPSRSKAKRAMSFVEALRAKAHLFAHRRGFRASLGREVVEAIEKKRREVAAKGVRKI